MGHILNPGFCGGCGICSDCEGERGERGKRGKRGHRGHRGHDGQDGQDGETGPTGPTGPVGSPVTASGGLLKFSGTAAPAVEGSPIVSFLEDYGAGVSSFQGVTPVSTAPAYPVAVARNLRNLATNLLTLFFVPDGGQFVIELVKNLASTPVVIATITYAAGDPGGIKSVLFGPEPFAIEDTFDLRVTASGTIVDVADFSATVGVE